MRPLLLVALLAAPLLAKPGPSGLDLADLDRSVAASADFYQFANGGWLKRHAIPPQAPQWGQFHELSSHNTGELYGYVLKAIGKGQGSDQKLADFYRSGMDITALERLGLGPLNKDFEQIRKLSDVKLLLPLLAGLHAKGISAFFDLSSIPDAKNTDLMVAQLSPAGLGLPDPEYYQPQDEKARKQLEAYRQHLQQAFRRLGHPADQCARKAEQVLTIETRLAAAMPGKVARRDPLSRYHPTTLAEFSAGVANWSWPDYFQAMGVSSEARLNLSEPRYLEVFHKVLEDTEISALSSYLEWRLLEDCYDYLSEDWCKFRFEFYGKILTGAPTQSARNGRVLGTVASYMGEALAEKFVAEHFSPKAKAQVTEMVTLIQAALREEIKSSPWMSPTTQNEALLKLSQMRVKVGAPSRWPKYENLKIDSQNYLENVLRARAQAVRNDLAQIGTTVDREQWYMSADEVNAAYIPSLNEIVIPAGIAQPPFFSTSFDDAVNFGGLGTVIGHEITHGFDDQGRKYDQKGNLRDWWQPLDLENFNRLAQLVAEQFSSYTVLDGKLNVNGPLVLGESIADLGGLRLSFAAYQKKTAGKPAPSLDGFTPEQRFFLGYARLWATHTRADYERLQINVDVHPPARHRVNGPLSNLPEFAKAFQCPPGSPMVRPQAIRIW